MSSSMNSPILNLSQLSLLPFLSASLTPTLILPTQPIFEAITTKNSILYPSPHSPVSPFISLHNAETILQMPGVGTRRKESEELGIILNNLLNSLQPEWTNESWVEMYKGSVEEVEKKRKGKGKGRIDGDIVMNETEFGNSAIGGSSSSGSSSSSIGSEGRLKFLDRWDQRKLLSGLIDLLEAPHDQPRYAPGQNIPSPPSNLIQLSAINISATLLPLKSHFILTATAHTLVLPLATSTTTHSTRSSRSSSPFVQPLQSNGTKSPTRPTLALSTPHSSLYTTPLLEVTEPFTDPYTDSLPDTELGNLIKQYPWHQTSLGPIVRWGPELKAMVSCILLSPFAEVILFGDESIMIYNDAYISTAGGHHPQLLGQSLEVGWSELWEELAPVARQCMEGIMFSAADHQLVMTRNGFPEETYHTFRYAPFRDSHGKVLGFVSVSFETTARVVAERRLATIRDLVAATPLCRTISDFCAATVECLSSNPFDLSFAILYTANQVDNIKPSTREVQAGAEVSAKVIVKLSNRGSVGVPNNHILSPSEAQVDLTPFASRHSTTSGSGSTAMETSNSLLDRRWSWPFEEACLKKEPVFIENLKNLTADFEARGWEDLPKHAVVVPIFAEAGQVIPQAILVVGVNTRGSYDVLYKTFLQLVARHTAIGLLAVCNAENDAKRAAELIALDRAKTNFLSNVSHELRTPLTLVLGPLEDVLSNTEHLSPGNRERLVTVQRHANRLLQMVNKLLDFSSLEGGRMQVKYRPVKIGRISNEVAESFRDAIERGKIKYTVVCDDDPVDSSPIYLATDLWEKVIFNLIGNSFKYCLSGAIEVTLRSTRAEAVISVKDTGVGIPSEELSKIFERFHRVDSTSRATTGTGIGLALTLEIVKVLGGTMEVQSEVGVGSTFSVRLPRGFTHLPIEQVFHEAFDDTVFPTPTQRNILVSDEATAWRFDTQQESSSASSSNGSNNGSGSNGSTTEEYVIGAELLDLKNSTVLLVDDSVDIRSYVTSILSKVFHIVQMPDGQAALEYALKHPPALVVTDVMMPRLDGRGLLAALRSNPLTSLIPVIFLSAQAGAEAKAEALEQGADDYLVKPFQARELMARVRGHLQLGKMRKELERRVEERTRALNESEGRYRGLADRYSTLSVLSPVGIFLIDHVGNLTYANPRWYEISGHPLDKPLSEWRDSVHPEDLEKTHAFFVDGITAGRDAEYMEFRFRQGSWVQFELRFFQDAASIGSGGGFVGAITDISRPKQIEALHIQTVDQRAADAEENRRQMDSFIDMASHELRNPLSGVLQNAEVIGSSLAKINDVINEMRIGQKLPHAGILDGIYREMIENSEAVESIMLCASHQGRIADDILNVSKLNMGLLSINLVPFDLASKMSDVLRMFSLECLQKCIALNLAVGESVAKLAAHWIVADPSRLAQILINFLTNAIKYTADSKLRQITVQVEAFDGPPPRKQNATRVAEAESLDLPADQVWVVVGVQDSGKGLSNEELKKLFLRFSQANAKSDQYSGFGLGLFVSRALVELHSGFIEVESQPGEGSTFRFAIPAARVAAPTSPSFGNPSRIKRTASGAGENRAHKAAKLGDEREPMHVLIVEDNLINQRVMQRQLLLENYTVSIANHGKQALDILQEHNDHPLGATPISIVLMDIEMPIMDGLTAIRELREREKLGVISRRYNVIAVTGNARQGQIDECLASGFDDVAIKPYRMVELMVQIARLVD